MRDHPPFQRQAGLFRPALHRAGQWLNRLLVAIGLITVLVMATPIVSWWARAYSGPVEQPKGDVLILRPTGVRGMHCWHGKRGASRRL